MRVLAVLLLTGVLLTGWVLGSPAAASQETYIGPALHVTYNGPILVDNSQVRYTGQDRLTFSTADLLASMYPDLVSLRPVIDTWASRLGIHPRVLSAVVDNYFAGSRVDGNRDDIDAAVQIATALATVFAEQAPDRLAASRAVSATSDALFFQLRLPEALKEVRESGIAGGTAPPPLYGYFQPPWPIGDTWAGGGAHGTNHSALDLWGSYRQWGEDVSSLWVSAMQSGTARVWSSCGMAVIHDNGWVTGYYHLDNIQVADGATVERNDWIANYANNLAQATCAGGSSTGPHVHVSLKYDDTAISVDETNVDFTAFSHHAGVGDYDFNCNTSWYTHYTEGQICPSYDQLLNNAAPATGLFSDGFESGSTSTWSSATR